MRVVIIFLINLIVLINLLIIIGFIKNKKIRNIFIIFIGLSVIFFNTSLSKNISEFTTFIWVFIPLMIGIFVVYMENKSVRNKRC